MNRMREAREVLRLSVKREWEGETIGFPRVSASCEYVAPALFEDVLDVAVSIERIGTKSVTYRFEFTRSGTLIARGKVTSCCVQVGSKQMKGIEIPAGYRKRLES